MSIKNKTVVVAGSSLVELTNIKEAVGKNYYFFAVPSIKTILLLLESVVTDLILIDEDMPHFHEVIGVLKESIETAHIPIILLVNEETTLASNVADYLLKPVSHDLLLSAIEKHI